MLLIFSRWVTTCEPNCSSWYIVADAVAIYASIDALFVFIIASVWLSILLDILSIASSLDLLFTLILSPPSSESSSPNVKSESKESSSPNIDSVNLSSLLKLPDFKSDKAFLYALFAICIYLLLDIVSESFPISDEPERNLANAFEVVLAAVLVTSDKFG